MPKINPRIKSIDDLLGLDAAEESPIEPTPSVSLPTKNTIITLPPQAIRAFRGHPFRLYEGDRLNDLVESISEHGVLNPAIIRKIERDEDGFEYEMLAGHNRQNAAAIANRELPCIVKENLSDEDAWIYVIETNVLQRSFSEMLPSEKAAVLTLRYSKMICQGRRNDIVEELKRLENPDEIRENGTCGIECHKSKSRDVVGAEYDLKGRAVANYVFKNHILPGLGDIPLSGLTSEMIGDFLEERRRFGNHRPGSSGLGEETMRHIHRLLQQCLDQAMRDGLISDNPARAFHYSKPKKVNADVLTPLEMEDYLDAAERLGYLPMFMLALTTGLRQGELIALKWSDLDIESRTLTIAEKRAVVRRELVEYGSQTRSIRLTPEVVDLLIMEHSKHPSSPLMFMHPATLKPYSPQMVRRMHNEIIKEAGIDHIRYVDLRHTCAILALKNGMDTKELARMLGHYRPAITRQNYEPYLQHKVQKDEDMPKGATQSELQQAANILDNLLKF